MTTNGITLPVAAGLAIGIAFVILFASVDTAPIESTTVDISTLDRHDHFLPDRYEHVNISIAGLNDRYAAGEPIAFSAHFIGFIPECDIAPNIKIIQTDSNKLVYQYNPLVIGICSVGDFVDNIKTFSDLNGEDVIIAFAEGGKYKLIVEQYGEKVEKEFVIVRADSGKSGSADVLPDGHELVVTVRE